METETQHTHVFSVDTACGCGVMLSAFTRRLAQEKNDLLRAAENAVAVFQTDGRFNGEASAVARLQTAIAKAKSSEGRPS